MLEGRMGDIYCVGGVYMLLSLFLLSHLDLDG